MGGILIFALMVAGGFAALHRAAAKIAEQAGCDGVRLMPTGDLESGISHGTPYDTENQRNHGA